MRYQTGTAFRRALEMRLAERAKTTGTSLQRLRKAVAFERLLARLLQTAPDRWVLKGGLALDFRIGARARATKDMDLAHALQPDQATADLMAASQLDLGDYFTFISSQTDALDDLDDATAVRYHVRALLGERTFEDLIVDIGLLESEPTRAGELFTLPDFLSFADIPPITVPMLPLAQHVAEKLHAYTRTYGDGTRISTREKDLVDLVVIADFAAFTARSLTAALTSVFVRRGRQPLPTAVPLPPPSWGVGYRKLAAQVGINADLAAGHAAVAAFLDLVLSSVLAPDASWDPSQHRWIVPPESEAHGSRVPGGEV